MDMYARFTQGAQQALADSQRFAKEMGNNYVGTEHLLLGLVKAGDSSAAEVFKQRDITVESLRADIDRLVGKGNFQFTNAFDYTPRCKKIIQTSLMVAQQLGHNYVGTDHLLLSLISETDCVAAQILMAKGIELNQLANAIVQNMSGQAQGAAGQPGAQGQSGTPTLDQYGKDLTKAATNGELDPVIGREPEIERIIQILSRRTKNNPVLIGDPGVGKSAVVEGLAQEIVKGNIPELLKGKRVVTLDLAGMVAGSKYRGEFEERIKSCIDELKKAGDVILFIDEMHTIIGAGATEGAMDAANILKPALARGEIQIVGATTLDEYRKHIEKDAALERRFQPVMVGEPTVEQSIQILRGLRDRYEAHHKVRITDAAIEAAVTLSDRYISDRFLPDKAIDLMDEAASKVRIASFVAPPDLKNLESELQKVRQEKEEAVTTQNYEKAAKMRDEEKRIKDRMDAAKNEWDASKTTARDVVEEEDIAQIVAAWTHIPVTKLTEDEAHRLLQLEDTLHKRVIGQQEAVSAVARAIRRANAGLKDPKRPVGSFLFLGPTGVGKTELSKALAQAVFGDENAMVRVDMSEYMEKHAVSKFVGSPPGYVGYDEGGQLTEKIRRQPYSVILLDEIEKAHPDVFNILLQILEDGRLTDAKGRTVDFKNTVIIMTSNVGAGSLEQQRVLGFDSNGESAVDKEAAQERMMEALKHTFRPEFLNRIDDIIVFHALDEENIREIARLMLDTVADRLKDRDIEIQTSDAVVDLMAKKGFDPVYGARPLRRAIQQRLEDALSEEILEGRIHFGQTVLVDADGEKLTFTPSDKPAKPAEPQPQANPAE